MTAVVIHAEMRGEARVIGMFGVELLEERNRLGGIFKEAERFGFHAKVQLLAGAFAQPRDVFDAVKNVLANFFFLFAGRDEFLERAGQGADAAFNAGGQKFGEQIKKQICVSQSFRRSPVGAIDIFLHACAVKISVGKSVDGENVATVFSEPALKFEEHLAFAQFHRRAPAQAQADGEGFLRADFPPHGERVGLERRKRLRPRFAAMNVGAIREVQSMVQFHRRKNARKIIFGKAQRGVDTRQNGD